MVEKLGDPESDSEDESDRIQPVINSSIGHKQQGKHEKTLRTDIFVYMQI
jgi:hypothetical protein